MRRVGWWVCAAACGGGGEDPGGGGGTDPGDAPAACVESSVTPVADPTVAEPDMSFAAQTAIDRASGEWLGAVTWVGGGEGPGALDLTLGAVDLVRYEVQGGGAGSQGAPSATCLPLYRIATSVSITADTRLVEQLDTALEATSADDQQFDGRVALAEVQGTLRPSFDPEDWATTELVVGGVLLGGSWTGTVSWFGSDPARAASGSGTAEAGGVSETAATYLFSR